MSHSLGFQPGNSWLGSSKVPEPTGKRLRRFVRRIARRYFSRDSSPARPPSLRRSSLFPVQAASSIPPTGRHRRPAALNRSSLSSSTALTLVPRNLARTNQIQKNQAQKNPVPTNQAPQNSHRSAPQ